MYLFARLRNWNGIGNWYTVWFEVHSKKAEKLDKRRSKFCWAHRMIYSGFVHCWQFQWWARPIDREYIMRATFFFLFGFLLALFVRLLAPVFSLGSTSHVRLFPPLIFELNCGKLLNFMWQMCERLRLNKYFNRSERWSINHDDKLGGYFTLAPLLSQSRAIVFV